ncbi:cysteine hydrolase family protein [Haladaptatus halobius]|uniref:cysteine hydrolase family protein n=1 Tax=Haladaptatus halobius TaxID=2884875 RepID=UPI001D09BD35|nr:cysteine hydrolase [Haladaptatus halobius]
MRTDTAVITVDLHHGHLDPETATLPVPPEQAERVLENTERFLTTARDAGYPVFHITTAYRDAEEILSNPKWAQTDSTTGDSRESVSAHNLEGTTGTEIMSRLRDERDVYIQPKKRYSPFLDTDLEFVLRTNDVGRLLITGVNTNTCVQCTCFEATNRDYEVVVIADCVASMDGPEFHESALMNIDRALGSVVSLEEILEEMESATA